MVRSLVFPVCCLGSLILGSAAASAQFSHNPSFGTFLKKSVVLTSRLPPIYPANGKTIDVVMENGRGNLGNEADELQGFIESLLTQNNSGINVGGTSPDLYIDCNVGRYSPPEKHTATSTDGKTTTVTWTASILVEFRIYEPSTNLRIKSANAESDYTSDPTQTNSGSGTMFGLHVPGMGAKPSTPPTPQMHSDEEIRHYIIDDVARQIAAYVVQTNRRINVPLAIGGALDSPEKLALNGLWSRNLEELETIPAYPDARNQAYLTYDIGVANEALAYEALDNESSLKYLQKASIAYGKALDSNKNEKNFLDAQNRIQSALENYAEMKRIAAEAKRSTKTETAAKPADGAITDDDIIALVKNGVDQPTIIEAIQTAPAVNFDLTVKGLIKLGQGGVKAPLITVMRKRAAPPPAKK